MKIEFSKLILIVAYITAVFFSGVAAWLALFGVEISAYSNIVLVIWGMVTTGTGFYYWKAKSENLLKIAGSIASDKVDQLDEIRNFVE